MEHHAIIQNKKLGGAQKQCQDSQFVCDFGIATTQASFIELLPPVGKGENCEFYMLNSL